MKGSERDSEQVMAREIESRSNLGGINFTEPLSSVVKWVKTIERDLKLLDGRVLRFEQLASEIMGKLKKAGIEIKDVTRI